MGLSEAVAHLKDAREAAQQGCEVLRLLDEMYEVGFGGTRDVIKYQCIDELESQINQLAVKSQEVFYPEDEED